jgi:excisionase family DNA binding protein
MTVRTDTEHEDGASRLADMGAGEESSDGKWLSIHEACQMLGVDQSTLRRWSDSGKVPVFRTPGGHRRYAESELRALVGNGSRRFERQRIAARQLADQSRSAFVDEFWRTARSSRWYRSYTPSQLEDLRRLGRRLVDLAVRYASTGANSERQSLLEEGRTIGQQYGRVGAMVGLSGAEAVEAYLYFRAPVVHSLTSMTDGARMGAASMLRVSAEVNNFLDQVMLAMVREHEDQTRLTAGIAVTTGEAPLLDDA